MPEPMCGSGCFVCGIDAEGAGGAPGAGCLSGSGDTGGGAANGGATSGAAAGAGAHDGAAKAGAGVVARGVPLITMLRVTGAEDTRGRLPALIAELPALGSPPPPPPSGIPTPAGTLASARFSAAGCGPLRVAGWLPTFAIGAFAAAIEAVLRDDCGVALAPGRGWCRPDFLSLHPKRSPPKRSACATATPTTPGPATIAHEANAQLIAALRIHHRFNPYPHGQRAAVFDHTTSHPIVASVSKLPSASQMAAGRTISGFRRTRRSRLLS